MPGYQDRSYQTYESNLPFVLRFMVDQNLKGASWVELPPGEYSIRSPEDTGSTCQIEADIAYSLQDAVIYFARYDKLKTDLPEMEMKIAPLRILSFGMIRERKTEYIRYRVCWQKGGVS